MTLLAVLARSSFLSGQVGQKPTPGGEERLQRAAGQRHRARGGTSYLLTEGGQMQQERLRLTREASGGGRSHDQVRYCGIAENGVDRFGAG